MPCTTSVIRKACAVVRVALRAVTPFRGYFSYFGYFGCVFFWQEIIRGSRVSTSPNMTSNRWFLSGIRCPRAHPKPQLSILILAKKLPKTYFSVWKSIGRSVVIRPLFSAREINRALGCNPATIFLATSFSVCSWRLFIWLRRAFYLVGFGWAGFLFGWAWLFI